MKALLLVLLTLSGYSLFAQSTLTDYSNFDIRNSSCDIINATNVELKKTPTRKDFDELVKLEQNKYPLKTQASIDEYIKDFNSTLAKTKQRYESQEFLWKTAGEIGKYGLNVLGNYAQALPTKHLTNFLTPAVQQGYQLYIDNEINNHIEIHKNEIDDLIKKRINLLYSNGIDLSTASDEAAFSSLFNLAHGDLPALNRDQYGIFNKELTARAYDFLEKNRQSLQVLDLKATQQYEQVKKEVNERIDILQKQITGDVNKNLKELGESIVVLTKNQDEVFKSLANIQKRILANEDKIRALEKEMLVVKNDIVLLKTKQDEHDKLLEQNAFQIDILSGYAFQNLNTGDKLNALRKGHFDNIFKDESKQKLIADLEKIKSKETIISVSQTVQNYANVSFEVLTSSGLLKGKDAKIVGKFIYGLSIATGIARVYAGDFSGFTSIISGISGLTSKPTPSPEMQMLKQIYDVMNSRFDKIDEHLNIIETKIDSLTSLVYNMYKSMALSFQYTGSQLERINWKIDVLNSKATALLYKDYQACKTLKDIWENRKTKFDSYGDYITNYNANCQKCLEGLNDFTIGKNSFYFTLAANEQLKKESFMEIEVNDIYKPTKDLFKLFYSSNLSTGLYALMFPFSQTKDTNKPIYAISKLTDLKPLDRDEVIENYFSYEMINEFSGMLLKFGTYFETAGNNSNFKPLSFPDYLRNNDNNGVNQDLFEVRLSKLLNITQYAISQQSLLAGNLMLDPIYSTLFNASFNQEEIDLSLRVLNNNKLLAANFATYLINKNIDLKDTLKIRKLFSGATIEKKNIDTLNSLVKINDLKFVLDESDLKVHLTFIRKGQTVSIPCPNFSVIISGKMLNSDSIFSLLETRENVNSKLINLTFSKNINSDTILPEKFKFFYVSTDK